MKCNSQSTSLEDGQEFGTLYKADIEENETLSSLPASTLPAKWTKQKDAWCSLPIK